MIIVYKSGKEFIDDNIEILNQNKYLSAFFFLDAKLIEEVNNINYVIKVINNDKYLLALKVIPFNLLLMGDKECLDELLGFIKDNNYEIEGILCPCEIGDYLVEVASVFLNKRYKKMIGMDFMEAIEFTEKTSSDVVKASIDDLDQVYECAKSFYLDCGLKDNSKKEDFVRKIDSFRIIKKDGLVVSMARFDVISEDALKISFVYTRPEYRNKGLGRKVVNAIKNEILSKNMTATLNVDQANPISNHLYKSLGFKKVFAQGEYEVSND